MKKLFIVTAMAALVGFVVTAVGASNMVPQSISGSSLPDLVDPTPAAVTESANK